MGIEKKAAKTKRKRNHSQDENNAGKAFRKTQKMIKSINTSNSILKTQDQNKPHKDAQKAKIKPRKVSSAPRGSSSHTDSESPDKNRMRNKKTKKKNPPVRSSKSTSSDENTESQPKKTKSKKSSSRSRGASSEASRGSRPGKSDISRRTEGPDVPDPSAGVRLYNLTEAHCQKWKLAAPSNVNFVMELVKSNISLTMNHVSTQSYEATQDALEILRDRLQRKFCQQRTPVSNIRDLAAFLAHNVQLEEKLTNSTEYIKLVDDEIDQVTDDIEDIENEIARCEMQLVSQETPHQ